VRLTVILLGSKLTLATLGASVAARAENAPKKEQAVSFEAVVTAARTDDGLDAQRRLDRTSHGFATAIEVDFEAGARPADALPELVSRAPGATVRSLGGLGQFSAVSVRGSSAQQVGVFLDGVPLDSAMAGLVDLSDLPLDTISTVEIYRGYIPVEFGGATIGGAVNLVGRVHRGPTTLKLDGGIGSFGGRQARLSAASRLGDKESLSGRLGYSGANGDFTFLDDGNTPVVREDDRFAERTNNDYDRLLGHLRLDGERGSWRYAAQQLVVGKEQGLPGVRRAQTSLSRLTTLDGRTVLSAKRTGVGGPGGRLTLVGSLGLQRQRYLVPADELVLPERDQVTRQTDAYLSCRLRLPLWAGAFATAVLDSRGERIEVDERALDGPIGTIASEDARRERYAAGAGVQIEQYGFGGRLVVAPAVRADLLDSHLHVQDGAGEQADLGRDLRTLQASPRLGVRLRLADWLELRSSVGRYFRPPTLLELFGNHATIEGNEGLVPERGVAVDAGLVAEVESGTGSGLYLQTAGFATWSSDLIQWEHAGRIVRPRNVAGARVFGFELGSSAHAWGDRLRIQAAYTLLDTRNEGDELSEHGQPLSGRPRHEVFARLSAGNRFSVDGDPVTLRMFTTHEHTARVFLDPSGRRVLPPRTLHGAGWELLTDGVRVALELRNLLNERVTTWTPPVAGVEPIPVPIANYIGFPLPGRTIWLSVAMDVSPSTGDRSR
jgi:iron complex outermembrane receptor protein